MPSSIFFKDNKFSLTNCVSPLSKNAFRCLIDTISLFFGNIEFISNDQLVFSAPLVVIESVEAKGFFGRIWARIVFWIMSLFSFDK